MLRSACITRPHPPSVHTPPVRTDAFFFPNGKFPLTPTPFQAYNQYRVLIAKEGVPMTKQRNSRQRQIVYEAVMARSDHPTADQIYLDVRARDDKISRGTVYRNLGLLARSGQITHVKVPSADRYDLRLDKHYHLFCTRCGRAFDAPVPYREIFDAQVAEETGFEITRHRMIFEGV